MKTWLTIAALATLPLVQGCAAAVGAGGAIAADQVAEENGGNLF